MMKTLEFSLIKNHYSMAEMIVVIVDLSVTGEDHYKTITFAFCAPQDGVMTDYQSCALRSPSIARKAFPFKGKLIVKNGNICFLQASLFPLSSFVRASRSPLRGPLHSPIIQIWQCHSSVRPQPLYRKARSFTTNHWHPLRGTAVAILMA